VWEAFGPTPAGAGLVRLRIRRELAGGAELRCDEEGLDHPQVREVLGRERQNEWLLVASPPLNGLLLSTLADWLFDRARSLSEAALVELARGIAEALDAALVALDPAGLPRFLTHGQLTAGEVELGSDGSVFVGGFAAPGGSQIVDRLALATLLDGLAPTPSPELAAAIDLLRLPHPPPGGYRPFLVALSRVRRVGGDLEAEIADALIVPGRQTRYHSPVTSVPATRVQRWSPAEVSTTPGSFTAVFESPRPAPAPAEVRPRRLPSGPPIRSGADSHPSGAFARVFEHGLGEDVD